MKYCYLVKLFVFFVFFVGTTISCRNEYESCSKNSKNECCSQFECRKPRVDDQIKGNNARCFKREPSTIKTTEKTTTSTTYTTEQTCRIQHQSCSNASVTHETCCKRNDGSDRTYKCRSPRPGEFGYEYGNNGNTRCFFTDDNDVSIENEESPTTTKSTTPSTTSSTTSYTASTTTEANNNTTNVCAGIDQFCENDNCCGNLVCIPIYRSELATCNPPAIVESTPPSTIEIYCATENQECRLRSKDCCQGLECQGNGTSYKMGTCKGPAWTTTNSTTERTTTQETCRKRNQTCNKRGRGKKCCETNEKLQCRRNDGGKHMTCQGCSERFETCRKSKDCCQYANQEENICHRPNRKEPGTCGPRSRSTSTTTNGPCQQKNGFCRGDVDCCQNQEDLYCEQNGGPNSTDSSNSGSGESRSGESSEKNDDGTCQVRAPTTTASQTTTTTQESTTQWCSTEGQECENSTSCCYEQGDSLECLSQLEDFEFGSENLGRKTCQRSKSTTTTTETIEETATTETTEGTTEKTEGTSTTSPKPIVNQCQQKNGFCRGDVDCCQNQEDLYCEQNGGPNSTDSSNSGSGESRSGESSEKNDDGTCQVRVPTTTTTYRTTTTTTQRSTTQWCSTEGQECENSTSCCYEQVNALDCLPQLVDFEFGSENLERKTCQRPSQTTTKTTEGTTTTLIPLTNECSSRGGLCPNQTDDECCAPWKCISVDGRVWQCGERGVNGTSIAQ